MPYTIDKIEGRWRVASPKGKLWKTTYPTRAAAEKGVAYVESRFAGGSEPSLVTSTASSDSPDTADERRKLGIPRVEVEEAW